MTTPAEKQRRYRQRRREDRVVVRVAVSRQTRDALVDAGRLPAWDEDDRSSVERIMQDLVDDLALVIVTAIP